MCTCVFHLNRKFYFWVVEFTDFFFYAFFLLFGVFWRGCHDFYPSRIKKITTTLFIFSSSTFRVAFFTFKSLDPSGTYFGIFLFSSYFPSPLLGLGKLPSSCNGLCTALSSLAHFFTERPKQRARCSESWLEGGAGRGD